MHFTSQGVEYLISFHHEQWGQRTLHGEFVAELRPASANPGAPLLRGETTCSILRVNLAVAVGKDFTTVLGRATVRCSAKDNFWRAAGRDLSFPLALKNAFPPIEGTKLVKAVGAPDPWPYYSLPVLRGRPEWSEAIRVFVRSCRHSPYLEAGLASLSPHTRHAEGV